ncbi:GNAT family N-acetyltransferase [Pelagibius sp. Alg239-R121]|uniref:GNAT family N-acetyltransferase n=1 Tax=Pelagibius sp. Alg239-R121 TaxID=2993448 RepID=UPI0024A72B4F|nr:GNAT family N-acetyltransferase [Pelagibius sp. Alg239-R121]
MSMINLRLELLDRSNWRQALEVRTRPDQLAFVADHEPVALVILAKCYLCPGGFRWRPFGILSGDSMVGIVALADRADRCELYHLVIHQSRQRQGYGKAALIAIVDLIRRELPDCKVLSLTVNPRNAAAEALYRAAGFQTSGEHRDGEAVWRLELTH